jgi:hypothetical protein
VDMGLEGVLLMVSDDHEAILLRWPAKYPQTAALVSPLPEWRADPRAHAVGQGGNRRLLGHLRDAAGR